MGKSGDAVVSFGADKRVLPNAEGKKKTKKKNKKEKTHSSGSSSSENEDDFDDDDDENEDEKRREEKGVLRKRTVEGSSSAKKTTTVTTKKKTKKKKDKKKEEERKSVKEVSSSGFLKSEWFQSWLGRVLIYMFVLVAMRTLKFWNARKEGNGSGLKRTTGGGGGGRRYDNYGKSTCDAIQCDFARAQLKRITREAFRGTAVSAFEQIESNTRYNRDGGRSIDENSGGFESGDDLADTFNANSNKPLVLALVSDDQSDFDSILAPGSTRNPFKMAEKKGCFKRLIVNDPYESSLKTSSRSKNNNNLSDPREIAERKGEIQKELSEFFIECGKKTGGGVVYVRMAKHINVKLLPALLPAFSENGGYTVDGELVPSKDFVFVLEVLKPIVEKSSAFSRERSEYAKALKSGNEATFTRIVKSKLAFYWGVDEEDESLSANALAMRRRVDYVVPVSVFNKNI
tara:strand:- start:415 stop:1788 length:1374 start_codon:yes stop_codon:yes gene_type:complete